MKKQQKTEGRFVASYFATMDAPAWRALPLGARLLYLALKRRYDRTKQGPVFLSIRAAATELGSHRDEANRWFHALEHAGFIIEVRPGSNRAAPWYRLTDEKYQGAAPTGGFSVQESRDAASRKAGTVASRKAGTQPKGGNGKGPDFAGFSKSRSVPESRDISRKDSGHLSQPRGLLKTRGKPGHRVRPDLSAASGADANQLCSKHDDGSCTGSASGTAAKPDMT